MSEIFESAQLSEEERDFIYKLFSSDEPLEVKPFHLHYIENFIGNIIIYSGFILIRTFIFNIINHR